MSARADVDIVPYDPEWLPQLAALARAHARLTVPYLPPSDEEVAAGLRRHAFWRFYTPSLEDAQVLLAVRDGEVLAAAQTGFVGHGWGYGAADGDGPDWLHEVHCSLFWLLAWPAWRDAAEASAHLAAAVVAWARKEGLPGVEAFRGGPGFVRFGTQLSSHWPHLWAPLRACGFRQPRDLLVYGGDTDPAALPRLETPDGLSFRSRSERLEAWLDGEPAGLCAAQLLRGSDWAVIRRLVVDPSLRGIGIGSALMAEQLRRLHARGTRHFVLHLPDESDEWPAKALYARFGRILDRQQVLRVSF